MVREPTEAQDRDTALGECGSGSGFFWLKAAIRAGASRSAIQSNVKGVQYASRFK